MDNKDKLILAQQVQIGSLRYTKSLMQKTIEDQSEEIKNYRKAIAIYLVFCCYKYNNQHRKDILMNIYLLNQSTNLDYDSFDSAVVIAENEEQAVSIHPYKGINWDGTTEEFDCWTEKENVIVTLLGYTDETEPKVVLAS